MNTNSKTILLRDEVFKIIGCALDVLNKIGHGYHEKPYENALTVAFRKNGIPYSQQKEYPIVYLNEKVGVFIPDLVVFDAIIVDTKVIDGITDHERGQILNYLRISGLRVGLLINFKHSKLEWERIVL